MSVDVFWRGHRSAEALLVLGQGLYKEGKYEEAIKVIKNHELTVDKLGFSVLDCRAASYEKLGQHREALRCISTMMRVFKDDAKGYLRAGRILESIGKSELAIEILGRGLSHCTGSDRFDVLQSHHRRIKQELNGGPKAINPLDALPTEIAEQVFGYLPFTSLVRCLRVSKQWTSFLGTSRHLWKDIDLTGASKSVPIPRLRKLVKFAKLGVMKLTLARVPVQGERPLGTIFIFCPNLETLIFRSGGRLGVTLLDDFRFLKRLKTLDMTSSVIIDISTVKEIIETCQSLSYLNVGAVVASGRLTKPVPRAPNLRVLKMSVHPSSTSLRGLMDFDHIFQEMPPLEVLHFLTHRDDRAGIEDFESSEGFPNLKVLKVDERVPGFLRSCRGLEELQISASSRPRLTLMRRTANPPVVQDLSLGLNGAEILELPCLKVLKLTNDIIEREGVGEILKMSCSISASDLEELDLSCNLCTLSELLQDFAIDLDKLRSLRRLALERTPDFGDEEVIQIMEHLHHLEKLDVSQTFITGVGVKAIVQGAPGLLVLNIDGCNNVGPDAVLWARSRGIKVSHALKSRW